MLSHAFWMYVQVVDHDLYCSCAGFMRTYAHLICYEVDIRKAVNETLCLIPSYDSNNQPITFERFRSSLRPSLRSMMAP